MRNSIAMRLMWDALYLEVRFRGYLHRFEIAPFSWDRYYCSLGPKQYMTAFGPFHLCAIKSDEAF